MLKTYLLHRCLCGRTDKCGRHLWSDPYRRGPGNIRPDTCARNKQKIFFTVLEL